MTSMQCEKVNSSQQDTCTPRSIKESDIHVGACVFQFLQHNTSLVHLNLSDTGFDVAIAEDTACIGTASGQQD